MQLRKTSLASAWRSFMGVGAALALFHAGAAADAGPPSGPASDLTSLSLDELWEMDVTSVSKREEHRFGASAAVYVVTGEEIRRMGARNVMEALRMVPGVQVAQLNSNRWAISIRGFEELFSNKLLVLVDGRSVYSPLFSGVFWDMLDVSIDSVERIEVIRGPGAALWGANAVNGIINIITRGSLENRGGTLQLRGGTQERAFGEVSEFGSLGRASGYRLFAQAFTDVGFKDSGIGVEDDWGGFRTGLRLDWKTGSRDNVMLTVGVFEGQSSGTVELNTFEPPKLTRVNSRNDYAGAHVLARWEHQFSERSKGSAQLWTEWNDRKELLFEEERRTVNLSLQHEVDWRSGHELIWGLELLASHSDAQSSDVMKLLPAERWQNRLSGFAQEQISLARERVSLTLGSKIEYDGFASELQIQPSLRAAWTPTDRQTLWAAVSRASRTPARGETDFQFSAFALPDPPGLGSTVVLEGDSGFRSEELYAFELGWRGRTKKSLVLDVSAFYNRYNHLRGTVETPPRLEGTPPRVIIPLKLTNALDGKSYGLEAAFGWQPIQSFGLAGSYAWTKSESWFRDGIVPSPLVLLTGSTEESPRHSANLRAWIRLPSGLETSSSLFFVDRLPAAKIPAYLRADLRVAWKARDWLELEAVGTNLLEERHAEISRGADLGLLVARPARAMTIGMRLNFR